MKENMNAGLRIFRDKLFAIVIILFAVLAIVPLFLILFYIVKNGWSNVNWTFLTQLPKPVGEPGSGVANGIIGSFMLITIATLISVIVGILIGIFLSENRGSKMYSVVRFGAEILQGIPSIVIGILAYIWVVKPFGHYSALSGGIALGVMMFPVIIITTEETLILIPFSLREASLALGVNYSRTILKVILPAGLSGIITGIILAMARVAGETAPLLFTSFGNQFMNWNILKPVNALPLTIFNYTTSPYPEWHSAAWGASVILILFVLLLNLIAKIGARKWKVQF